MHRKMLCHQCRIDSTSDVNLNKSFDIEYYLLESLEYSDKESDIAEESTIYGVEICKVQDGKLQESSADYNISHSIDRTKSLIDLLAANSVTPDSFEFVMSDRNK